MLIGNYQLLGLRNIFRVCVWGKNNPSITLNDESMNHLQHNAACITLQGKKILLNITQTNFSLYSFFDKACAM